MALGKSRSALLGKRLDDSKIGISLGQIECAKLLLIGGEPVGIVGVVRLQEAEDSPRLARVHLLPEALVRERLVAENVDRPDLGEVAFVDFEHHVDAVLVELDDLRLDAGGKAALRAIKLEDPVDVGTDCGAGEYLPRRELDLGRDLVVLEALVALQDDPVDHRVFANVDDDVAGFAAGDRDVGEELGRVEVLQRLVEGFSGVALTRDEIRICANRLGLEPLVAAYRNRLDHPLLDGCRCRCRWGRLRLCRGGLREQRRSRSR